MFSDIVHNDGGGDFICSFCGMKFHSRKGLKHHTNRGHPEVAAAADAASSNVTDAAASEGSTEDFAIEDPTSKRKSVLKCTFCPQTFDILYDKQQHIYQIHKDEIVFCKLCNKPAFGHKSLNSHLKTSHKEALIYCRFCEKKFLTEELLSYHLDECHDDIDTGGELLLLLLMLLLLLLFLMRVFPFG